MITTRPLRDVAAMSASNARLAADSFLRRAVGLHRDPRQADLACRAAAGVVAHGAGRRRVAAACRASGAVCAACRARLIAIYAGIGVLVALHWLTFYGSIKLSNASVAATCMALTPVFIAFIEPFLVRRRFDPRELIFGLAVIPGVMLVVGGTPDGMRLGIAVGALSALLRRDLRFAQQALHRQQRRADA